MKEDILNIFQKDVQYDKDYAELLDILSKEFEVSFDAIHGYNYNTVIAGFSNLVSKNRLLSFLMLLLSPVLIFFSLFKRNNISPFESDIVLEEWRNDVYKKYYKSIIHNLDQKYKVVRLLYEKRAYDVLDHDDNIFKVFKVNDYIDKRIIIKVLKVIILNVKLYYILYKLSKKYNINMFYIYVKFLLVYIKYHSIASCSNPRAYLSGYDLNAHTLKYEIFLKYNIKMVLMQTSMRVNDSISYKSGEIIFCYGSNQGNIYSRLTNNFKYVVGIGSIMNSPYLNMNYEKEYDILFVEQLADYTTTVFASTDNYFILLSNLIKFSKEYPQYKILYKSKLLPRTKNMQLSITHKIILDELEQSKIIMDNKNDSYEKVVKSKITIGYFSALCFESIGLGTPTLFCYYDNCDFELFDFKNSGNDILLRDSNYELFRKTILDSLQAKDHNVYFNKYKQIYMNQDKNIARTISRRMEELL